MRILDRAINQAVEAVWEPPQGGELIACAGENLPLQEGWAMGRGGKVAVAPGGRGGVAQVG